MKIFQERQYYLTFDILFVLQRNPKFVCSLMNIDLGSALLKFLYKGFFKDATLINVSGSVTCTSYQECGSASYYLSGTNLILALMVLISLNKMFGQNLLQSIH